MIRRIILSLKKEVDGCTRKVVECERGDGMIRNSEKKKLEETELSKL